MKAYEVIQSNFPQDLVWHPKMHLLILEVNVPSPKAEAWTRIETLGLGLKLFDPTGLMCLLLSDNYQYH